MKKISILLIISLLITLFLSGCANNTSHEADNSDSIKIVATIFPEYDWVKNITKDTENVELTMLLDSGIDLHSYQPTAEDLVKISKCDLFIYVGGLSDEWVEDALAAASNKDMKVINLMEVLGDRVKEEEVVEGMEAEEEEEEEGGIEYDEHVWLSLKNAEIICDKISEVLCEISPKNSDVYQTNCESYISELVSLDKEYENMVSESKYKTLVFADRFPFRYLVNDYGLDYYAAFVGCSAESEASFETILFLANKIDEIGTKKVLKIEGSDSKIADTVISSTQTKDQEVLEVNSIQSVTSKDVSEGADYLNIMKANLEVFKLALN